MLEIKNIEKLKNKTILYPYYIKQITPVVIYDSRTFDAHNTYNIEVTNNKETLLFKLDRKAGWNGMYELQKGIKKVHIGLDELKDMKTLIDWMAFLLEGKTGIFNHINQSGTTIQI